MQDPSLIIGLLSAIAVLGGALAFMLFRSRSARRLATVAGSHYHALVEQSPNGVLIADAGTLRILAGNSAAQRNLGYTLDELRSLTLTQLFTDESLESEALAARLRNPDPRMPLGIRQCCKNGNLVDVEISGNRLDLGGGNLVLAFTTNDVTLRRKIEAQLLEKQQHLDHLAHHDQLTGLPNRLFLAVHLPEAINEARRTGATLAVLFLDLDRFKHINDSRGHEAGDKLLKTVAARVKSTVREEDVVVRMGGDEFIVVLKNVKSPQQINETASRINEALSAPVILDGRPLVTTVSIGVEHVSARRQRHRRAASTFRHRDVPGEGSRPKQFPALQPWHGPQAEGTHRHRIQPARRYRAEAAGRSLSAHHRHRNPSRDGSRSLAALETSSARLRRSRPIHRCGGRNRPHRPDRGVRSSSG